MDIRQYTEAGIRPWAPTSRTSCDEATTTGRPCPTLPRWWDVADQAPLCTRHAQARARARADAATGQVTCRFTLTTSADGWALHEPATGALLASGGYDGDGTPLGLGAAAAAARAATPRPRANAVAPAPAPAGQLVRR